MKRIIILALSFAPSGAFAAGFELSDQSVVAAGTGGATRDMRTIRSGKEHRKGERRVIGHRAEYDRRICRLRVR